MSLPTRRTTSTLLLAAALVAASGASAAAAASPAPAAAVRQAAATTLEGPYCPEKAPWAGRWISSAVRDGHHIDTYLVPFLFGYRIENVVCD